jgi:hypothetical protein
MAVNSSLVVMGSDDTVCLLLREMLTAGLIKALTCAYYVLERSKISSISEYHGNQDHTYL